MYRQPEGQGLSASEEEELCFALVQIINIKQWNLSTAETDLNKPLKAQTIQALGPTPAGTFTVLRLTGSGVDWLGQCCTRVRPDLFWASYSILVVQRDCYSSSSSFQLKVPWIKREPCYSPVEWPVWGGGILAESHEGIKEIMWENMRRSAQWKSLENCIAQTQTIQALPVNTLLATGIGEKKDPSAMSRFNLRVLVSSLQKELTKTCPYTVADGTSRALDLNR